jgi:DNA-binding PadR family transcriptional regulator
MKSASELTSRQQVFFDKLLELYREQKGPVHYSDVAERLGVNPFSAYDMLKVLEKKGFASSSYALAAGHSGPGRSMVVFTPTAPRTAMVVEGTEDVRAGEEWHRLRTYVLNKLKQAREANPREALSEVLARLPEASAPLTFCGTMIGALLLNMQRVKARAGGLNPFPVLASLRTHDVAELETLAGLSVGVALSQDDEANPALTRRLIDHMHRYQANLSKLTEEGRAALVRFLEEALSALD